MYKVTLLATALVAAAWIAPAATPAKQKTTKRKHTAASAATFKTAKTTSAKTASTKTAAAKSHTKSKGKKTAHRTARSYQQIPTPERYKEIQDALASKGYFHGESTGEWGPESTDALKRFQADQNLMPDGKIGSLSLIALGLGPKRLSARSDSSAPPAPPAPSPKAATP